MSDMPVGVNRPLEGGMKMLKKILKPIRKQLLKLDCVKRRVELYKLEQKKQRHYERFTLLMRGGEFERSQGPQVTTNKGLTVEYMDGRMVGQRCVTPLFIDSVNWGGK